MMDWLAKRWFLLKWGRAARRWPLPRLLDGVDLDLSEPEIAELRHGIHSWRWLISRYLHRFNSVDGDRQAYCFGVAHGSTVFGLLEGYRNFDSPVPHMHLFDSFQGLPAEDPGIAVPAVWHVGAFAAPVDQLRSSLAENRVDADGYTIHEGWFSDTLRDELVADGTFRPAAYVDIDADLYNSTYEVLDFMFRHSLIGPGTLIGYDDWGDSEPWTAGESRAHKEITEKYNVKCAQLFSWGERPLVRKLFLVHQVGA